jgi:hypothetical protein
LNTILFRIEPRKAEQLFSDFVRGVVEKAMKYYGVSFIIGRSVPFFRLFRFVVRKRLDSH